MDTAILARVEDFCTREGLLQPGTPLQLAAAEAVGHIVDLLLHLGPLGQPLGPVGLVGGFFVKGKDVELPAGSELYIQTQKDVTTKGLVTASGAPNMVLRKRVAKSAVAGEAGSTMASDAGSSVNTVENMRNELKFVNEDGDEIDTKTKTVKSDAEETKADVSGTAEKAADEGEENASVVIVRNE